MLKTVKLAALFIALTAVSASPARLLAQETTTTPDAKYRLAIAKTHTVHASDNAILLRKYAMSHKTVPADIVKEHTAAMKFHLQAARNSYAKLATAAKTETDPKKQADLLKQISTIDTRLAKINDMVKKLETQTTTADEVALKSAEISNELATSRAATQSVDDNFYNMDSSNYYEDGLGHFTD
ncbi:MAG TPA: hypothetical protein VGJ26_11670 [Pirellulales bacterium]|jgi:predicted  nucleic acid-binding Zn-ribbon protein